MDRTFMLVLSLSALVVSALVSWRQWLMWLVPKDHFGLLIRGDEPLGQQLLLPAGRYSRLRCRGRRSIHPLVEVPTGAIGLVHSNIGPNGRFDGYVGDFTDVANFLAAGQGYGLQILTLPTGKYAIHPRAFSVVVIDEAGSYIVYGESAMYYCDQLSNAHLRTLRFGTRTALLFEPKVDKGAIKKTTGHVERITLISDHALQFEFLITTSHYGEPVDEIIQGLKKYIPERSWISTTEWIWAIYSLVNDLDERATFVRAIFFPPISTDTTSRPVRSAL